MSSRDDSPIEQYLDALLGQLASGKPREIRHLLNEAEAHLRDAADASRAAGMSEHAAETQAVARMGPASELARAEILRQRLPLRVLARQTLTSALLLAAIGATAIGVSGAIAAVIRSLGGSSAVADAGGRVLSAGDCARWLALQPGARSCAQAATTDWAAETVYYRIAFGVIGMVVLLALAVTRRRKGIGHATRLPATVIDTIGVTAFAVGAAWTLALGVIALRAGSGHGWGQWLSATPVAIVAATIFGARLIRDLRGGEAIAVRARG